ncbi:DHHW family protein [Paenibacillus sp. GCM10023252]|uniref:DHHW family protein n=1 Tax=Paenibacillus sp. GCM10023252 TaxID=3252649 RepID=UPI00361BDA99
MSRTTDRLYVFGFLGLLGGLSLLFLLLPKLSFSELENRSLERSPELTWDNLWSKAFAEQSENFVTDHFPFRDSWVSLKSMTEQLRLQQENNGIYKGQDGMLLEKFGQPDYLLLKQYAEAIGSFVKGHGKAKMTFLLAPNSIGLYPERLPLLASAYPQNEVIRYVQQQVAGSLTFLNGYELLKPYLKEDRPLYYRTDHHWTTYGAYLAYAAYARQMGWQPKPESDFEVETVTRSFLGSYHTRSQFSGLTPDTIEIYQPKEPVSSELYIADTDKTRNSLYDSSYLTKKDKYGYFQGGVHALMTFKLKLKPEHVDRQKLLVIKDSYAHSMLPFLSLHVPELHVIDIRYYNGNIGVYLMENEIEDVLLLFNTSTFVTNQEVLKLGR